MAAWVIPAAAAAGSIVSTYLTNSSNNNLNAVNREWEARKIEIAHDIEERRRAEDLLHSSPSYVRQQFEDAGLNPYMMLEGYNAGVPSSMSATMPSSTSSIPMQDPLGNLHAYLSEFLNNQRIELENKKVDADIKKTNAEIAKLAAETSGINLDNELKKNMNPKMLEHIDAQIKQLGADVAVAKTTESLQKAQASYQMGLLKTEDLIRNEKLRNIVADTFKKNAETNLTKAQIDQVIASISNIYLDNTLKATQIQLNGMEFQIKLTEAAGLDIELGIKKSEEWQETYKRMGKSSDELTKDYVNGITSALSTALMTGFFAWLARRSGKGMTPGANPLIPVKQSGTPPVPMN